MLTGFVSFIFGRSFTDILSGPEGSVSKLNTYRDGLRILGTIVRLFKPEPIVATYLRTGLVPRLPTATLCAALMLFGVILLVCGIILDAVTKGRVEQKRFAYLAQPAPGQARHA